MYRSDVTKIQTQRISFGSRNFVLNCLVWVKPAFFSYNVRSYYLVPSIMKGKLNNRPNSGRMYEGAGEINDYKTILNFETVEMIKTLPTK